MKRDVLIAHLRDVRQDTGGCRAPSELGFVEEEPRALAETAAYERGLEDASVRSSILVEQALAAAASEVQMIRERWSVEWQNMISKEAAAGRARLEERLSTGLVRALAPFIDEMQRVRIRASFLQFLRETVADGFITEMTVSGPASEEQFVLECLGKAGVKAVFHPSEGDEMEAAIGDTVVNVDFGSWAQRVLTEFVEGRNVGN